MEIWLWLFYSGNHPFVLEELYSMEMTLWGRNRDALLHVLEELYSMEIVIV